MYAIKLTLQLLQLHECLVCVLLCFLQVSRLHGVHHSHLFRQKQTSDITQNVICFCTILSESFASCVSVTASHQIHKHTHVLLGQPVEKGCWISGKDLIVVESGDGLDALLQLLQTGLHALYLNPTRAQTL